MKDINSLKNAIIYLKESNLPLNPEILSAIRTEYLKQGFI